MAKKDKEFTYTISIFDWDDNLLSGYPTTVTLKHGESTTINDIIDGYTYTITETDTEYTENYKIEKTDETDPNQKTVVAKTAGATINKQALNESHTVTFINNYDKSVETGVFINTKPYYLLVFLSVVILIIFRRVNKLIGINSKNGKRFK